MIPSYKCLDTIRYHLFVMTPNHTAVFQFELIINRNICLRNQQILVFIRSAEKKILQPTCMSVEMNKNGQCNTVKNLWSLKQVTVDNTDLKINISLKTYKSNFIKHMTRKP